ncbi:MAG: hypothetical protein ISR91_07685 [Candidatus Delongbacteria bacterium]|nr:hypothetical protein [Candidatus Delongbacteria bacterium]
MSQVKISCIFLLMLWQLLSTTTVGASLLVVAEQGGGWDDNFLRLSANDQRRFEHDAGFQTDAASIGSWRLESRLYVQHYRRLNSSWRLVLAGNLRLNLYPENEVNNYQAGMLSSEVRHKRFDRLQLQWEHLNDFYLRDFRHPYRDYNSPARFNSNTINLRWSNSRLPLLQVMTAVGVTSETYLEPFSAYDLVDRYSGVELVSELFDLTGQLRYQLHLRDNVGYVAGGDGYVASLDSEGGDATAREHDWRVQFAYVVPWHWLKDITFNWRVRHRRYQTGSNGLQDPVHAGRIDRRQYLFCELEFPLVHGFSLEAGWQREWRQTEGDWLSLGEYKDYRNDRNWLNLKYRWFHN